MRWNIFRKKTRLEEQLSRLNDLGIELASGFNIDTLLYDFDRKAYEDDPYRLLMVVMGGEVEDSEGIWIPLSDHIWHLDKECIEDQGDYVRIAQKLSALAHGNLSLEHIQDYVDIEHGKAWVSFSFQKNEYKWDLKVNDDWIDSMIFSMFNKLLTNKCEGRFAVMNLEQDCLIGFFSKEQIRNLNELTNIEFKIR